MGRRFGIIAVRSASAVSLFMMMSIPTKLCQDLIHTAMAVDVSDFEEAQRRYCLFWQHSNTGRRWYNAVMAAPFLVAVGRTPIGLYILVNLQLESQNIDKLYGFVFTVC